MSKLAAQMYTVRDFTKRAADFAQSLQKIRAIGYRAVQLSAIGAMGGELPEVDATTARKMLDDNGLRCIATHRDWKRLSAMTEAEIDFHQTLGCDYTAIGGIPHEYGRDGAYGYRRFIADALPVIAKLKTGGIRFGHHNHAHEFAKYDRPHSEKTLWDILIDEGGDDYYLELDLYWAWHGGIDPTPLLHRTKGRVPVIHIKDKEVVSGESEPVMAAIGEGNLPWADSILPACAATDVEWYCVEQDICRRDPFDCLRSSFDYLAARGI